MTYSKIKYGVFEWPAVDTQLSLLTYTVAAYQERAKHIPAKLLRSCRSFAEAIQIANRLNKEQVARRARP